MTKTKKLIAILVALAMVVACVAVLAACAHKCNHVCEECGKCTDATCENSACADKCPGHESPDPDPNPDPEHKCGHVCPICGKCTDASCQYAACVDKCEGHQGTTEFPVSSYAELAAAAEAASKDMYYVAGFVASITDGYNSTIIIKQTDGSSFQIYGVMNEDGSVRYQKPNENGDLAVGDYVVFYGGLTTYQGTAQMAPGWIIQRNTDVKTNVAKLLLTTITIASPVSEDFELPTAEGKISWTVKEGTGIEIVGNTAKVTRTEQDQTVVLTANADVDGVQASKDFTVVVSLKIEGQETIVLNVDTLNIAGAYANNGGATVGGIEFAWIGMGNYGAGMQMRTNSSTGTSSFWNVDALGKIIKVELIWRDGQTFPTKSDNLKVEFANSVDFADATSKLATFAEGSTTVTYTFDEEEFTFVRITHNNNGAVYLDQVKITYEVEPECDHAQLTGDVTGGADATCMQPGRKAAEQCPDCGKFFDEDGELLGATEADLVLPALGHDYTGQSWAHLAETDTHYMDCTRNCEEEGARKIEACEKEWIVTDENHKQVCSDCEHIYVDETAHSYPDGATECECGHTNPEHTHVLDQHIEAKLATCIAAGNIEYYTCTGCNKVFSDEALTQEITTGTTVEIDDEAHVWGDWTHGEADAFGKHSRVCTLSEEHTEEDDCTIEENECSVCEHTYTAKEIGDAVVALDSNKALPGTYKLVGTVTTVRFSYTSSNGISFDVNVDGVSFYVYKLKTGTDLDTIDVGSQVTIIGNIEKYNAEKEVTNASLEAHLAPEYDVTFTINENGTLQNEQGEAQDLNGKYRGGDVVKFKVKVEEGYKVGSVTVGEQVLHDEDGVYTLRVTGATTVVITIVDENAAVDELVYTLTPTGDSKANNSYDGNGDVTIEDITWNIEGNAQMTPWRFGGKGGSNASDTKTVDRSLSSKTAIEQNINRIVITFGSENWNASALIVNSVTLKVYSSDPTQEGATLVETIELTEAASGAKVTVNKTSGKDWSNCYYQVTFNVTLTGKSNTYITITTMEFWVAAEAEQPEDPCAEGHTYDQYEYVDGTSTHKVLCSVCGTEKDGEPEACTGEWTKTETGHSRTCDLCKNVETKDHEWATTGGIYIPGERKHTVTCTVQGCDETHQDDCDSQETGTCSVCGHIYVPEFEWMIAGSFNKIGNDWATSTNDKKYIFEYNHETGTYTLTFNFEENDEFQVKKNVSGDWNGQLGGGVVTNVSFADTIVNQFKTFNTDGNVKALYKCTAVITLHASLNDAVPTSITIHVTELDAEEEKQQFTYTFHVYNGAGWGELYIHLWDTAVGPLATGGWPGKQMVADNDLGSGWFVATIESTDNYYGQKQYFIINNGNGNGKQLDFETANTAITLAADMYFNTCAAKQFETKEDALAANPELHLMGYQGWSASDANKFELQDGVYTITVTLNVNDEFKLFYTDWIDCGTVTLKNNVSGLTITKGNNFKVTAGSGTFKLTYDINTKTLTIDSAEVD